MKIRLINIEEDYPVIKSWWEGHDFPSPPQEILPRFAVMAMGERDEPLAATFLYREFGGVIAFVEWTITNPDISPLTAAKAVSMLLDFIVKEAQRQGYPIVLSSVAEGSGLQKVMRRDGWHNMQGKPHSHMLAIAGGRN